LIGYHAVHRPVGKPVEKLWADAALWPSRWPLRQQDSNKAGARKENGPETSADHGAV